MDDGDEMEWPAYSYENDMPCIRCLGSTGSTEPVLCVFCVSFLDGESDWDPRTPIVKKSIP
jgi:hypothetical protein